MRFTAAHVRPASAALVVSLLGACVASDEMEPDRQQLAVVMKARLGPCLNQALPPDWPQSSWRPASPKDGVQLDDTNLVSDGTRYFLHFADGARSVYVRSVAGLTGQEQVFGPLSLAARCPSSTAG